MIKRPKSFITLVCMYVYIPVCSISFILLFSRGRKCQSPVVKESCAVVTSVTGGLVSLYARIKEGNGLPQCSKSKIMVDFIYNNPRQIRTQQILRILIFNEFLAKSVKYQQKHTATRYQKRLTLHEIDNKSTRYEEFNINPKILSKYVEFSFL